MTTTIDLFQDTLQKTGQWLSEIQRELDMDNEQVAYKLMRGTLQAIRDQLPTHEAVQFCAQMPTLIRGIYMEGWKPTDRPVHVRNVQEFYRSVQKHMGVDLSDIEHGVRAVIKVIDQHISAGEVSNIKENLPRNLLALWEG